MDGQQQVMQQLAELLKKANVGVDQLGPLLLKQVLVEQIFAVLGVLLGFVFFAVASLCFFHVKNKIGTRGEYGRYAWDDGAGWLIATAGCVIAGSITVSMNVLISIQLLYNPMWYVLGELIHH